jgi:hypothetical protein
VLAGVAVVVTLALFAGAIVAARLAIHQAAPLDAKTLCPAGGPTAVTVVLIDATDVIGPVQKAAIFDRLQPMIRNLRKGEEVALYQIDPTLDLLKPRFLMCRPVKPSEVNEITGNRRLAEQRFETAFRPAVEKALNAALARPPSERSPIMEAIQGVSVGALQAADAGRSGGPPLPKRLIVVSDLLQNSEAASQYPAAPDFAQFQTTPAYARTRSDLSGVRIVILYLRRDTARIVQGLAHIRFWDAWFASQGATVDDVIRIEG